MTSSGQADLAQILAHIPGPLGTLRFADARCVQLQRAEPVDDRPAEPQHLVQLNPFAGYRIPCAGLLAADALLFQALPRSGDFVCVFDLGLLFLRQGLKGLFRLQNGGLGDGGEFRKRCDLFRNLFGRCLDQTAGGESDGSSQEKGNDLLTDHGFSSGFLLRKTSSLEKT